jgi:hypothetical protein
MSLSDFSIPDLPVVECIPRLLAVQRGSAIFSL